MFWYLNDTVKRMKRQGTEGKVFPNICLRKELYTKYLNNSNNSIISRKQNPI